MSVLQQVMVLAHLIGFAALLGGSLVQLREARPEVNLTMLAGAWIQLVSGGVLLFLAATGAGPLHWAPEIIVAVITVFLVVLTARNRRYADIPRGLLLLIIGLTFVGTALPVIWQ